MTSRRSAGSNGLEIPASPCSCMKGRATGSKEAHKIEQQALVDAAFADLELLGPAGVALVSARN